MKKADRKLKPYIDFIRKLLAEVDVDVDLSRLKTVTDCKNVINALLKKINDKMVKTKMKAFRCLLWVRHLKPTQKSYRIISMRL